MIPFCRIFVIISIFTQLINAQIIGIKDSLDSKIRIDSIKITGNKTTEDYIVLRELTFKKGDYVNKKILNFNRERVYSLGIFNFVNIELDLSDSLNIAEIKVEESWYIFPVPFIIVRGSGYSKASYGIEFTYKNFRGRNETLHAVFAVGYDPFLRLAYYNPLIEYNYNLNLTTSVFYQTYNNKSIEAAELYGDNFKYKISGGSVSLGKRLNQFNDFFITAGFQYIEAPNRLIPNITASGKKIERFGTVSLMYIFDSRDLKQFPDNGIYSKMEITDKGLGLKNVNYTILDTDFRAYKKFGTSVTARWRLAFRNLFGNNIPYYEYSLLGYSNIVRGHAGDERSGHNFFLTSLEGSYTLIDEYNISLNIQPIPQELTSARLSLRLNIFYDTGLTYNNGAEFWNENWDSGWGAGIILLILPYNALRLEYAVNEDRRKEFILGAGFAF